MLQPSLLRRFRTNDNNHHYHRLAHPVFSDTVFASTVSKRGNRCAQVYATDFGWTKAFPMASRDEAHETLSLLFVRDGVALTCIYNNTKELVQGKFHQKLKEAACHLKQLELYTGQMPQRERSKSLRKGPIASCSSLWHQTASWMIV